MSLRALPARVGSSSLLAGLQAARLASALRWAAVAPWRPPLPFLASSRLTVDSLLPISRAISLTPEPEARISAMRSRSPAVRCV